MLDVTRPIVTFPGNAAVEFVGKHGSNFLVYDKRFNDYFPVKESELRNVPVYLYANLYSSSPGEYYIGSSYRSEEEAKSNAATGSIKIVKIEI